MNRLDVLGLAFALIGLCWVAFQLIKLIIRASLWVEDRLIAGEKAIKEKKDLELIISQKTDHITKLEKERDEHLDQLTVLQAELDLHKHGTYRGEFVKGNGYELGRYPPVTQNKK